MKRLIILVIMSTVLFSCGSKEANSPDFLYGSKLYKNYIDFYLKGKAKLAEGEFMKAEHQFLTMDAMCNLSRMYIGRYVLDEEGDEKSLLEKASEYAKLGACEPEREAIMFHLGAEYKKELLPAPYSLTAGLSGEKLLAVAEDKDLPDYTKTRLLRKSAIDYMGSNAVKSEEIIRRSLDIDKFNGWSINILRDLIIMKVALNKQGKDTADVEKRIELLKAALPKK